MVNIRRVDKRTSGQSRSLRIEVEYLVGDGGVDKCFVVGQHRGDACFAHVPGVFTGADHRCGHFPAVFRINDVTIPAGDDVIGKIAGIIGNKGYLLPIHNSNLRFEKSDLRFEI